MNKILKFKTYIDKINESITFESDILMDDVDSIKMSLDKEPFNFNINNYNDNYTLEKLKDNSEFNKNLSNNELFISEFNNTKDFDTFLMDDIKYILIHERKDKKMNKLEKLGDPNYVIIQTKEPNNNQWNKRNINAYKINKNFNNFYKKLSSKTIEIIKGDKKYIYISNGKNWILKNIENKDIIFRDVMYNKDIKNVINNTDVDIRIIS